MKKKTLTIVSSCAAIAVCSSLIVGSTYALFTSKDTVNIAVTAGKVEVVATLGDLTVKSLNDYEATGKTEVALPNGGSASVVGNSVNLNGITPGDEISFAINVDNSNTTVSAKYRLTYVVEEGYLLADGLDIDIDGIQDNYKSYASAWSNQVEDVYNVKIALPNHTDSEIDNLYMGLSTSITFNVEAIQANGVIGNGEAEYELLPDYTEIKKEYLAGTLTVAKDAADLKNVFRNSGKVVLAQDITTANTSSSAIYKDSVVDLNGYEWTINTAKRADATKDYTDIMLGANSGGVLYTPNVEIVNGTLNIPSEKNGHHNCAIQVAYGSGLKLDGVELNVPNGSGILALDPNTNIEISNSSITTDGYAITTNGTSGWGGATVSITDSEIAQTGTIALASALLFNNIGQYTVERCNITSNSQAIFARGGNVTVEDCTIHSSGVYEGTDWKDGSRAPSATVIVGGSGSAYAKATVSITGCTISAEGYAIELCVWANINGTDFTTDLAQSILDEALIGTDDGGVLTINDTTWENN